MASSFHRTGWHSVSSHHCTNLVKIFLWYDTEGTFCFYPALFTAWANSLLLAPCEARCAFQTSTCDSVSMADIALPLKAKLCSSNLKNALGKSLGFGHFFRVDCIETNRFGKPILGSEMPLFLQRWSFCRIHFALGNG